MATKLPDNRWRAMIAMSSDHAGINKELERFEAVMLRTLANVEDARKVRDYLACLRDASIAWFAVELEASRR